MTEINWPSAFGYTDFCDDLRHEILGKTTLVGVYGGEMTVYGVPPLLIPKLVLAVHYHELPEDGDIPLQLCVFLPNDTLEMPSHKIDIPSRSYPSPSEDMKDEGYRGTLNFELQLAPVQILGPGAIRVRMFKGEDVVRLGSLRISIGTPEDAEKVGAQFATPPDDKGSSKPAASE